MKNQDNKNHKKLSQINPGEKVKVISMEGGKGFIAHLNDMGIRKDVLIELISKSGGPVFVKCGESRFAIGHEMANKIIVEAFSQDHRI